MATKTKVLGGGGGGGDCLEARNNASPVCSSVHALTVCCVLVALPATWVAVSNEGGSGDASSWGWVV